ncbi:hypothetical protein JTB14_033770 [Gonioctena quinquepunctata]|nr:hypothetical protein JTB14_033770 [Gonioctena quinquepunctata]
MWSYEREQARLQEMLEISNDEEGQGVAYDEHSDIDQSDDDEVDHVEEQHDNSDSEQDISDDGEMTLVISILNPQPAELTDEDSADEDVGGLVDNLSANQLRAAAEIRIYQQDNIDDNEIIPEALEEPKEEPQPVNSVEKIYYSNISWLNGDIVCNEKQFFSYTTRLSSSTEANTTKATQGRICNSSG